MRGYNHNMKKAWMILVLVLMAGCASQQQTAVSKANHSECLVCKKNADLACVDVDVDKTTPSAVYNGKTYYFCSDECKNEFLKHPEKYASIK